MFWAQEARKRFECFEPKNVKEILTLLDYSTKFLVVPKNKSIEMKTISIRCIESQDPKCFRFSFKLRCLVSMKNGFYSLFDRDVFFTHGSIHTKTYYGTIELLHQYFRKFSSKAMFLGGAWFHLCIQVF